MATRSTPTKRTTKTAGRRRGGAAQVAPRLDVEAITDRSVPGIFFRQVSRYTDRTVIHFHDGADWLRRDQWRRAEDELPQSHAVDPGL